MTDSGTRGKEPRSAEQGRTLWTGGQTGLPLLVLRTKRKSGVHRGALLFRKPNLPRNAMCGESDLGCRASRLTRPVTGPGTGTFYETYKFPVINPVCSSLYSHRPSP